LKQVSADEAGYQTKAIFILLSIKTRIETIGNGAISEATSVFLSYYPLKQGLKLVMLRASKNRRKFLSYYPLKQGLKLKLKKEFGDDIALFLSYYPLKQGLKLGSGTTMVACHQIFILLSIKTRIETDSIFSGK